MLFLHWEVHTFYDFGTPDDQEWLVNEIISHKWDNNDLKFQVCWNLGDSTWEPFKTCKDLQVLNAYLSMIGVTDLLKLP
jgi:hypothetical protein